MRKILLLGGLFILLLSGVLAEGQKETKGSYAGNYAFGGSTTLDPIITGAIEEWKKIHADVHISYEGVGSGAGVKGVIAGTYSLGAASRELSDKEKADGVVAVPVALDALAVVVNNSVGVTDLSMQQVSEIYAGKITNWKQVGGADAAIVVFNRDEASGTFDTFKDKFISAFKVSLLKGTTIVTSNGDMAAKVGSTPNAIGYVGLGYIDVAGLKALSLDKVKPAIASVYDGTYKVQRKLNVLYKVTPGKTEQAFIDYLLSPAGQEIVEDTGFIKLKK